MRGELLKDCRVVRRPVPVMHPAHNARRCCCRARDPSRVDCARLRSALRASFEAMAGRSKVVFEPCWVMRSNRKVQLLVMPLSRVCDSIEDNWARRGLVCANAVPHATENVQRKAEIPKICNEEQQSTDRQGEQPARALLHTPARWASARMRIEESPAFCDDADILLMRLCHQLRLYSVVVSTLVFETDILSISEYREPGFEPQYDLPFCSHRRQ